MRTALGAAEFLVVGLVLLGWYFAATGIVVLFSTSILGLGLVFDSEPGRVGWFVGGRVAVAVGHIGAGFLLIRLAPNLARAA